MMTEQIIDHCLFTIHHYQLITCHFPRPNARLTRFGQGVQPGGHLPLTTYYLVQIPLSQYSLVMQPVANGNIPEAQYGNGFVTGNAFYLQHAVGKIFK